MFNFSDKIKIIIGNPYVSPPNKVLDGIFKQSGKITSPIPVQGKIDGTAFKQTLVRYQGEWRLYVNIIMAKAAGIKFSKSISEIVGTNVKIQLEFDPSPPVYPMVDFFQKELDKNPTAQANWEKLAPSRQKEILRYFSWLKSDEAKERNLKKAISALTNNTERFMARTWKNGK